MEKLKFALAYGADAVYLGGRAYGLRAFGGNFSREELREAVEYAHDMQPRRRVYVTVNIFPHEADLSGLPDYIRFLDSIGVDALLVADIGVFSLVRELAPDMELHVSTQANVTNSAAVKAWQRLGARRTVLARELSAAEISQLRAAVPDMELEIFVHGAMCISYSGRCLLSAYMTGRDSNRGACAQSCRWQYALEEAKRPGEYYPVAEDERGTYILNSKDMCLLPYLPQIRELGVDSLKIEGRMKSAHYVASVVHAYREAIDACWDDPAGYQVRPEWLTELDKVSHRSYTAGFFRARPEDMQIYGSSSYEQTSDFIGIVRSFDASTGYALVEQRNNMKIGQEIEVFPPSGRGWYQELSDMRDAETGEALDVAPHAQQQLHIRLAHPVPPLTIIRRDRPESSIVTDR